MNIWWQEETKEIFKKFEESFKDTQPVLLSHRLGEENHEPLYVLVDVLIRYAKFYKKRFGVCLVHDSYCEPYFRTMLYSILQLCSMDGGVAVARGLTTDSKDNVVINHLIEKACEIAGIDYQDLSL